MGKEQDPDAVTGTDAADAGAGDEDWEIESYCPAHDYGPDPGYPPAECPYCQKRRRVPAGPQPREAGGAARDLEEVLEAMAAAGLHVYRAGNGWAWSGFGRMTDAYRSAAEAAAAGVRYGHDELTDAVERLEQCLDERDRLQQRARALEEAVHRLGRLLDRAVGELEAMAGVYMEHPQEYIEGSPVLQALRNARGAVLQASLFGAEGQDERV